VLLGILLLLLAAYLGRDLVTVMLAMGDRAVQAPPAVKLPAANALEDLKVTRGPDGLPMVSLRYAFSGTPSHARVTVFQMVRSGAGSAGELGTWPLESHQLRPGTHELRVAIRNPAPAAAYSTEQVGAVLEMPGRPPIRKVVAYRIQWPDPLAVEIDAALAAGQPERIVQKAVKLIDSGLRDPLDQARVLLQGLVAKSPRTDAAYVELARIAMKTNWGPTGLRDAETLIDSALQIRPDSVDAQILMGYVYAHQGRYKEADALFARAAASNPPNLWLWANWGEALAMQGKMDPAIAKYREAITRPPTGDTYDRARWDAYRKLLALLDRRGDLDDMQALLRQQAEEYGNVHCFAVDYARFLVLQRADIQQAVAILRD
jgi:tetratricopeptide (TPR) repeat protein